MDRNTPSPFLVIVLLSTSGFVAPEIEMEKFMVTTGLLATGITVTESSVYRHTPIKCIIVCKKLTNCDIVEINTEKKTCSYFAWKDVYLLDGYNIRKVVVVNKTIPVIHVIGVGGRYTLDFIGAQQVCGQLWGSVSSTFSLIEAYSAGYQLCQCGWVSENAVKFPMQVSHPNCGNTIGIITCTRTLANVYCTV